MWYVLFSNLAGIPAILTEIFRDFSQSLQANVMVKVKSKVVPMLN
jgi:hypothetical protein